MTGKEDFKAQQDRHPVLASMGMPDQRSTVERR
jgi:hypothetical protein